MPCMCEDHETDNLKSVDWAIHELSEVAIVAFLQTLSTDLLGRYINTCNGLNSYAPGKFSPRQELAEALYAQRLGLE